MSEFIHYTSVINSFKYYCHLMLNSNLLTKNAYLFIYMDSLVNNSLQEYNSRDKENPTLFDNWTISYFVWLETIY